ncbi:hypothetical protein MNBD_DELTA01-701 [hydrothermal vent metagenome]|uniref:HicB-like antitoxin of toxin-antitoxin system domain-containing protein n=1 Tax=hydrothermal vent metagenome TaxID=652676 RepID=A0A3B0R1G5_9ZZZZ
MDMDIECNAIVWKKKDRYLSICPELGISSFGGDVREAVENLVMGMNDYFDGSDSCVLHVEVKDDYAVEFDIFDDTDDDGALLC